MRYVAIAIVASVLFSWQTVAESKEAAAVEKAELVEETKRQTTDIAPAALARKSSDPYQQVELVTDDLIDAINLYKPDYPANEMAFFAEITHILTPHVDFQSMARSVMGPYRKVASDIQLTQFVEVFKTGLMQTYGRGLLSFNNEKIVIVGRRVIEEDQRKVSVRQEIHAGKNIYPLSYTLRRRGSDGWMITNVVINGINLGKTLRNQFVQATQKNAGNIDAVIARWSAEAN